MKSPALMLFVLFSWLVNDGDAKLVNFTVDDQFVSNRADQSSIEYDGNWKKDGFRVLNWDPNSSRLAQQFAKSEKETWTKSTFNGSQSSFPVAQFNFAGTAVYVQCILTHATRNGTSGNSQMLFTLDGVNTTFTKDALEPGVATVTTVFSKTDLSSGAHALTIQNGFPGGPHSQGIIFLDSITYTVDELLPPPGLSEPPQNAALHSSPIASTGNVVGVPPTPLRTLALASATGSSLTYSTSSSQPQATSATAGSPVASPPAGASGASSRGVSPIAPIVLGSIAGVSLLLLIFIALYIWRRRRHSTKMHQRPSTYASLYPFRFPRRQQHRVSAVSASTLTFDPGFYSTEDDDSYTPTKRSFALSPTEKAPFYDAPSTLGYGHGHGYGR